MSSALAGGAWSRVRSPEWGHRHADRNANASVCISHCSRLESKRIDKQNIRLWELGDLPSISGISFRILESVCTNERWPRDRSHQGAWIAEYDRLNCSACDSLWMLICRILAAENKDSGPKFAQRSVSSEKLFAMEAMQWMRAHYSRKSDRNYFSSAVPLFARRWMHSFGTVARMK